MWNAERFLSDHGVYSPTQSKHGGKNWKTIQCPMCSDHSDHGRFNLISGAYYCYRCGKHYTPIVISSLIGATVHTAKKLWESYFDEGHAGNYVPAVKKERAKSIQLPGGSLSSQHKQYLRGRGFDPDMLEKMYSLQGTDIVGDWRNRIIMPFFDEGELVTFHTRSIRGKNYRCLPPEQSILSMKELLYGEWLITDKSHIGVCEGPPDVWNMGVGFVATCGTGHTIHQVSRLIVYEKVYILFDPEPEAQKRAENLAVDVSAFGGYVEVVDIEERGDPGGLPKQKVSSIRKELGF